MNESLTNFSGATDSPVCRRTAETLLRSLAAAQEEKLPFRHWLTRSMLDGDSAISLAELPVEIPQLDLASGRRETNNGNRLFFDAAGQTKIGAMRAVAEAMQSPPVVAAFERLTGLDFSGTYLRIEYCRDPDGFWLEPHTDTGAKRITIMTFLSTGPESESWGTDIYDRDKRLLGAVPGDFNCGLIFVPGTDTHHGFEKRPIRSLRRSLMLNYVGPEWRSRHELCFPDRPVK